MIKDNFNPVQYVIYCRKSTEDSERQAQSIPDQIKACVDYAKTNWLILRKKDKDYDKTFENKDDILIEKNDKDIWNKRTYNEYKDLFIVKERHSAKLPWQRPKWKKLIELINKWKIKWLISYSPDRQARNMFEWWELLNLVDEWKVDLKYKTFFFENNASWKMMIWFLFVYSTFYSNKLSEDVDRWNKSKVEKWYALWVFKHWYFINEHWYHEPHPTYFNLIQQAFHMKIYDKKSDDQIAKWLIKKWYIKEHKGKVKEFVWKYLYAMRKDSFYYWISIHWKNETDLRKSNPYYKPIISEEEYQILIERYWSKNSQKTIKVRKEENIEIIPIDEGIVKTQDWYALSSYLPNKKRFIKKLEKEKIKNNNLSLSDIIKSNQIRFRCVYPKSKYHNLEITFDIIEKEILNLFKSIKITNEIYQEYVDYINKTLQELEKKNIVEIKRLNFEKNKLLAKKQEYIKKNMPIQKDIEEERIYQWEKNRYEEMIINIENSINEINNSERNSIIEFEIFLKIIQNAHKYYKKANYVQKRKITNIIILNIIINAKKQVRIEVHDIFRRLFSCSLPPTRIELVSTP